MLGKSEKSYMLIELFKDHNNKVGSLVGKGFAPATYKRYETSLRHTQAFLKFQFGVSDINIEKIDNTFINDYDYYLRTTNKCNNNSTIKYIKNLGKIIRICLSNGWIIKNPFVNYKGKIKRNRNGIPRNRFEDYLPIGIILNSAEVRCSENKKQCFFCYLFG